MKRPVLKLILALIPLLLAAWLHFSTVSLEEVVPATVGAVVRINHPLNLAEKLADAEMIQSMARMPDMQVIAALLNNWNKLHTHSGVLAGAAYFLRSVHVSIPSDLSRYAPQQMPFTTYVDLGFVGRLTSFLADFGLFAKTRVFAEYRGVRIYQKGAGAVAFMRNMLIIGSTDAVIQSIDAWAAGRARLRDNPARYHDSLTLADAAADLNVLLLSRSLFRPPEENAKPLDPRAFFSAAAIDRAAVNVYVEDEGLAMRMVMTGAPGKVLSPYTLDKAREHASAFLPDEGTYIYASVRVAQPSRLAPILMSIVAGSTHMQPLQEKVVTMLLTSFLDATGHEVALAVDYDSPGGFPTLVFQIKNVDDMKQILARMRQSEDMAHNVLNMPVGANGETLLQLLSRSKTDAELDQALHLLPAERRLEIVMLARKLRQGGVSLERIVLDPQRIGMFGRALHWRIVGEYLVLAPLPDLADRYATNLAAKKVVPELAQQAKKVNLDGPFLAWINLGAPLAASDPTNEHLASWLAARHPRLTVGSNVTDERIEFQARLPLDLGLHRTELNISFWWRGGVYVLRVLGWLLLAFCLYVVVKAIRHWMAPKQ